MQNEPNRTDRGRRTVTLTVFVATVFSLGGWLYQSHASQSTHPSNSEDPTTRTDWSSYNGDVTGDHYSPLKQITGVNVEQLKEIWRFDAGTDGGIQTNPLLAGRMLYGYDPTLQVIALDGATGKQLWRFNSGIIGRQPSRGFTYWSDGKEATL